MKIDRSRRLLIVGDRIIGLGGGSTLTRTPSFHLMSHKYFPIAPNLPSLYWMLAWCPADPVNDALFAMRHKLVG